MNWDALDTATLLPLVGVRTMSLEFGVLLRHYWMPATRLEYGMTVSENTPGLEPTQSHYTLSKQMVRCDADRCCWRQTVRHESMYVPPRLQVVPPQEAEWLCDYNRSRQSFHTREILDFEDHERSDEESQLQAFLQLPILTPLLPIPLGFQWHVASSAGTLDFCLESLEMVGNMPVVSIRRRGVFQSNRYYLDGQLQQVPCRVEREGITAYALSRSVILEDRCRDVVHRDGHAATTIGTTGKLLLSSACRKPAPLFGKYRTRNGDCFLYDGLTGHILAVDEIVYAVIEDWNVLSDDELIRKYHGNIAETALRTALTELDEVSRQGFLVEYEPRELSRVECVFWNRREQPVDEFWRQHAILLVLGLTERCNLCCEYCCYSGKFAGQRTHSGRSMSREIAEKAISEFLSQEQAGDGTYPITFYGGEPLLEFARLRECVAFAETEGQRLGRTVRFAITTNGTLLDDAAVDYLVEHQFLVIVSLDGPQAEHDRYRVFPDGEGSFETVVNNLRRFAVRYPDYRHRGFNVTLTPPLDLEKTGRFIEEWFSAYPVTRASLVNTGTERRFRDASTSVTQYGCSANAPCPGGLRGSVDAFMEFDERDRAVLAALWNRCMAGIARDGSRKTWETMPFAMMLFESQISVYHRRPVTDGIPEWVFLIPCLPGLSRRFCDAEGNYRVCERTDASEAFLVGNVWDGLDRMKFRKTMELRRHFGDCGNCLAQKVCDLCYARIPESDAAASGYDPAFDRQCQETRQTMLSLLAAYTDIMEVNEQAFDKPMETDTPPVKPILYGAPGSRLTPALRMQLERETI